MEYSSWDVNSFQRIFLKSPSQSYKILRTFPFRKHQRKRYDNILMEYSSWDVNSRIFFKSGRQFKDFLQIAFIVLQNLKDLSLPQTSVQKILQHSDGKQFVGSQFISKDFLQIAFLVSKQWIKEAKKHKKNACYITKF